MKAKLAILLLGIVLGLAAAVVMPQFWNRLLPQGWKGEPVEGVVESKRWEDDHLLLTLLTVDGAVLATFRSKVAEIDLLVAPGDTVSLELGRYRPFVEDPEIVRVVKAPPEREDEEPPPLPLNQRPPPRVEEMPDAPAAADPDAAGRLG